MGWQTELTIITRTLINDINEPYEYSNSRIQQILTVAAKYVQVDVDLHHIYKVDITNNNISPDPIENNDDIFISLLCLKAACIIDQGTFRTRALMEGIKTKLGPAELDVSGNLSGFKAILDIGPCALYENLSHQYNIGNPHMLKAILGPFVGNNFDPQMLNINSSNYRSIDRIVK
jgi:hypothetical protein